VSSRTYLSIGDVLSLLRKEFPDVTISKIRFLESQGLVNPERTPSGYRKFYEDDVERLRWVLRQQREHFLPLKVIKGRLEEETSATEGNGREMTRVTRAGLEVLSPRGDEPGPAREHTAPVLIVDPGPSAGGSGADLDPPETAGEEGTASSQEHSTAVAPQGGRSSSPRAAEDVAGFQERPIPAPGRPEEAAAAARERSEGVSRGQPAASAAGTAQGTGRARRSSPPTPVVAFSGASMTLEELAGASGLEPTEVQQLASYCLLSGRTIGGVTYFDEDALVVGRLAAAFAQFGVEARHLRLHLLAVQREAGFIEQVVVPLLKQRNPASRQRAHETVDELSRLGQELRTVLLQTRLREQLGG